MRTQASRAHAALIMTGMKITCMVSDYFYHDGASKRLQTPPRSDIQRHRDQVVTFLFRGRI